MPRKSRSIPIAIRINGRAVTHAEGAKLAAEWLGCTQTTGPQAGKGSLLQMVEGIGSGFLPVLMATTNDPGELREIADELGNAIFNTHNQQVDETLRRLSAALRNAARLREASET